MNAVITEAADSSTQKKEVKIAKRLSFLASNVYEATIATYEIIAKIAHIKKHCSMIVIRLPFCF